MHGVLVEDVSPCVDHVEAPQGSAKVGVVRHGLLEVVAGHREVGQVHEVAPDIGDAIGPGAPVVLFRKSIPKVRSRGPPL